MLSAPLRTITNVIIIKSNLHENSDHLYIYMIINLLKMGHKPVEV